MNAVQPSIRAVRVFRSGEEVDPGVYIDMDSGDVIKVNERDSLPEGIQVIRYLRRYRRVEGASETKGHLLNNI
ncbi:hypothetical protein LBMAG21_14440 [Armatimonadota bacterium]|nr:hypothetical protein LBMAG21_14440 [Armatimonadota bacterium]